jgi:putative protein-disulfide isomerase
MDSSIRKPEFSMNTTLYYVFDPLCGWCYGAMPALSGLQQAPGVTIALLPSGLFSGAGARRMDADFAAFAWRNDQRIASVSGQRFTGHYQASVLGNRDRLFDSGPATLALTAVSLAAPAKELDALKAIQLARFVDGKDITDVHTLVAVLTSMGLDDAAALFQHQDTALLAANRIRVERAQALMHEFRASGVPTFIAETQAKRWRVDTSANYYSDPQALIGQLQAA